MNRLNTKVIVILAIVVAGALVLTTLDHFPYNKKTKVKALPDSVLFSSSPVLSPEEAFQTFELEEGFRLELVASEPLIQDPVAMDFDEKGRIWVIEMQSYMLDLEGNGEDTPSGRIIILEDLNRDGVMDTSKIFMDQLVLPRAISVVQNGVLFAEPPRLWFVENKQDKPGRKTLVDADYAVGGNVEHQPNGLLLGIDNWHYNAKSSDRYRFQNGQWIKEKTEFRGQWGISKDNYGRLIYNNNSNQLRGDLLPPNSLIRNPRLKSSEGINRELAADQRVYPIRPTPGINRGYQDHMLDDELRLKNFTAACAPLVYRGDQFPESHIGNVFVSEPSGNLIKRNILTQNGPYLNAEQAYEGREFLASKDERFRPVNLYNGPDGGLYVVDMYRGVIQHKTYLTDYLREQIKSRGLQTPLGLGRIYRIVYEGNWYQRLINKWKSAPEPALDQASDRELVEQLKNPNGWWRDQAQRLLVQRNRPEIAPKLVRLLEGENSLAKIHALWSLEGVGINKPETIAAAFMDEDPEVVATAIRIAERNANTKEHENTLAVYEELLDHPDPQVRLQLALSLGEFTDKNPATTGRMLFTIAQNTKEDSLMQEAILSSVNGIEDELLSLVAKTEPEQKKKLAFLQEFLDGFLEFVKLKASLDNKELSESEKEQFILGKALFEETCAACHGNDGEGIRPVAPPLHNSHWITGPEQRLILITLYGLQGPVTVLGKVYQPPEVQPVMPGLKDSLEFTDEKLAAVLTYIRNAWSHAADAVHPDKVKILRQEHKDRNEPYTEKELMEGWN